MAHKIVNHETTLDYMKTLLSEQSKLKEKLNLLESVVHKIFLKKSNLKPKPRIKL